MTTFTFYEQEYRLADRVTRFTYRRHLCKMQNNQCIFDCGGIIDDGLWAVVHHDHQTDRIIGLAHDDCNRKERPITPMERLHELTNFWPMRFT